MHPKLFSRTYLRGIVLIQLFFLFILPVSYGQKIGVSAGFIRNNYFDFVKETGHLETDYYPGNGYSFAISMADIRIDSSIPLRLALLIDHYKGSFSTSDGGLASGRFTDADVTKTSIGLGVYPLNFSIVKRVELSIGAEFHFSLHDKTVGSKSWWSGTGMYTQSGHLNNDSMNISCFFVAGVSGQVGYPIRVKKNLWIVPAYRYYLGVSNEFKNTEAEIKSMRHNIQVGLFRNLR